PTSHALHALRKQIDDFVENNVAHEKKTGGRLRTNAKRRIAVRLDQLFGMMHLAAGEVENLGDWLIRIQHDLFRLMLGQEADRILFLPMADLTDLVRPELTLIADRSKEVDAIKASVARSQIAQHGEPYQRGPQSSTFWVHCPSCFRRTRQPWRPGTPVEFVCPRRGAVLSLVRRSEDPFRPPSAPRRTFYTSPGIHLSKNMMETLRERGSDKCLNRESAPTADGNDGSARTAPELVRTLRLREAGGRGVHRADPSVGRGRAVGGRAPRGEADERPRHGGHPKLSRRTPPGPRRGG